jgi:hypothetical protein
LPCIIAPVSRRQMRTPAERFARGGNPVSDISHLSPSREAREIVRFTASVQMLCAAFIGSFRCLRLEFEVRGRKMADFARVWRRELTCTASL